MPIKYAKISLSSPALCDTREAAEAYKDYGMADYTVCEIVVPDPPKYVVVIGVLESKENGGYAIVSILTNESDKDEAERDLAYYTGTYPENHYSIVRVS